MKTKTLSILGFTALSLTTGLAKEEAFWPHWRGPLSTGVVLEGNPPVSWDEKTNVRWRIKVPGAGHATPIVVGEKLFLLSAEGTGKKVDVEQAEEPRREGNRRGRFGRRPKPNEIQKFSVICLNRHSGKTLWSKAVVEALPHEGHHRDHGYASCSPVTDGEFLYAFFGSRGLYCLDLEGNVKWEKDLGDMRTVMGFGEGTSPVLVGNKILVKWDHEGDSFLVALDKKSGKELWRKERDEGTSWASPVAIEHGGKIQVVASASNKVASYNPENGDIIWESTGMTRNVIPTPVWGDGVVYVTSGFRGSALQAIKLDSKGKVKDTDAILWSHDEGTPYVPSPLLYQGRLYFFQGNDNRLTCLDAKTGKVHYSRQRVEGLRGVYASPIGAGDHIYLVGRQGNVVVIKSSDKLEIVATNSLDEEFDASPVVVGDWLYLRGKEHLYCLVGTEAVEAAREEQEDDEEEAQVQARDDAEKQEDAVANSTDVASSNVAGSWSWTVEGFGGQEFEAHVTLEQDGTALKGTYKGGFFGSDPVEAGKIEGDSISFKTVRRFRDNEFATTYAGKVSGDEIVGKIESPGRDGDTRVRDWHAYREPEIDPSGLWKWSTTSRRGNGNGQRDSWVKLAYAKGKLTGVYRTTRSQAPIKDAQLEGKELSFKVERGFGGRTSTMVYKGTLSSDGITGTYAFRRGDEDRSAEWKAERDTPEVDAVGEWTWTSRFGRRGQERENKIVLRKEGEGLAGHVIARGGEMPIDDAELDGDRVRFEVTMENDNGEFTSTYAGRIDGDLLQGTMTVQFGERSFERPFKAARVLPKPEPVGAWKWTSRGFGRDAGEVVNVLTLSRGDDGKLSGVYARDDEEMPVEGVAVEGNTLSFKLTRRFRDNEVTMNYSAQLRGDVLRGHYSFGENTSGWVTLWEAERDPGSKE